MQFNPGLTLVFGGFSLFFLISGVRALRRKRMMVVNPDSNAAWPGPAGLLMKAIRKEYEVPRVEAPPSGLHVEATGAQAVGMAWLYIVLGVAFLGVGLFDFLMRNDLLAFAFD